MQDVSRASSALQTLISGTGQRPALTTWPTRLNDQLALETLGADIEELFTILAPWGAAIRAGKGYLGAGPHDLG